MGRLRAGRRGKVGSLSCRLRHLEPREVDRDQEFRRMDDSRVRRRVAVCGPVPMGPRESLSDGCEWAGALDGGRSVDSS